MTEPGTEAYWARVMWQRHGVPLETFLDWSRLKRLAYIAAELAEIDNPVRLQNVSL